jgi:cytidyltransferase-like protein
MVLNESEGTVVKTVIVSGYFNPLHGGHIDMMEAAAELGDRLIVIVNNDLQQLEKKGKIILDEQNRLRLVESIGIVDEAMVCGAEEGDMTPKTSLEAIALKYPDDELIFCNGGDRPGKTIPEDEVAMCQKYGIEMRYGIGGDTKADSSTRINQALGHDR